MPTVEASNLAASSAGSDDVLAPLNGSLSAIWAQALQSTQDCTRELQANLRERHEAEIASKNAEIAARDEKVRTQGNVMKFDRILPKGFSVAIDSRSLKMYL
jgi:uncharacterized protein YfaQ (DUF2300 family)